MKRGLWILLAAVLLAPAPASAQVSPEAIVQIAKAVHDAEGWDLGARSTRDTRNRYWARVMAIVHFGHPTFNRNPDPRWCLKDGGNGRPQTDDVGTLCATREFWDFIGGVGADGYSFRVGAHPGERLGPEQNVYPPTREQCPDCGTGGGNPGGGSPGGTPGGGTDAAVVAKLNELVAHVAALTATVEALRQASSTQAMWLDVLTNHRLTEEWAAQVWNHTDPNKPAPAVTVTPWRSRGCARLLGCVTLEPLPQ